MEMTTLQCKDVSLERKQVTGQEDGGPQYTCTDMRKQKPLKGSLLEALSWE